MKTKSVVMVSLVGDVIEIQRFKEKPMPPKTYRPSRLSRVWLGIVVDRLIYLGRGMEMLASFPLAGRSIWRNNTGP